MPEEHSFLLQRVQPAMVGLIDGSLSTLAPIFSVAIVSHKPIYAFAAGLATSIGAAISMAFSEGLSDTGELTGRGNPAKRGAITGAGTFLGGILHTLPFFAGARGISSVMWRVCLTSARQDECVATTGTRVVSIT